MHDTTRRTLIGSRELDKRSNGALKANVYPGSSPMKVNARLFVAILLMCLFPGIATGLPDLVMGVPK